jgi:hypothetical protein
MEGWMSSPGGRDGVNIMMAVDLFWNGEPLRPRLDPWNWIHFNNHNLDTY